MDYLLVANARAGTADGDSVAEARAGLEEAGAVETAELPDDDALDAALDRLGDRALVVAGGDGTLHRVVQRLADRDRLGSTVVGVVPLGTGNDFARCLGLPLDASAAAAAIRRGTPRPLDLAVDDENHVVVNAAHTGISPAASARATRLKRVLGRAAYPVASLWTGVRDDGVELHVEVDGEPLGRGPLLLAAVMNGSSIGGGTVLAASADPGDGLLDVVVVADPGRRGRLGVARALRAGELGRRPGTATARGREIRIAGAPVAHNVDGELGPPAAERRYRVRPGAWHLLVP